MALNTDQLMRGLIRKMGETTTTIDLRVDNPPKEFIVEVWVAGSTDVVDFPIVHGAMQTPFNPVRGPVMRPRHEYHQIEADLQHCTRIVLNYEKQTKEHCMQFDHGGPICVDLVFVEPVDPKNPNGDTCTRRRASGTAFRKSTLLYANRDYIMQNADGKAQHKAPIEMDDDEYRKFRDSCEYGKIDVTYGYKMVETPVNESRLRELARAWFAKFDKRDGWRLTKDQGKFWGNPMYAMSRTSDCFPGVMIGYKCSFNATEDWWQKSYDVVMSRRPDLRGGSAELMIRVVKLWASTRKYVPDYIWMDNKAHLGDDPSILEYQTANDCEDFAWHLLRAFYHLKRTEFKSEELRSIHKIAQDYECFIVFGEINGDAEETDESCFVAPGHRYSEAGHSYTLFIESKNVRSDSIQGAPTTQIGEATNWQDPSLHAEWTVPADLHAEINRMIYPCGYVVIEHMECVSRKVGPPIVVHTHASLLVTCGADPEKPWAFRCRVGDELPTMKHFTDPNTKIELIPVAVDKEIVRIYEESLKYERPLPLLGKWDEKKAKSKIEFCADLAAKLELIVQENPSVRPVISFFVDCERLYWNDETTTYACTAVPSELATLVDWLKTKFKVTASPRESGHLVRLDCFR